MTNETLSTSKTLSTKHVRTLGESESRIMPRGVVNRIPQAEPECFAVPMKTAIKLLHPILKEELMELGATESEAIMRLYVGCNTDYELVDAIEQTLHMFDELATSVH